MPLLPSFFASSADAHGLRAAIDAAALASSIGNTEALDAMMEQAKQTRPKDLVPMFYSLLKVLGGLVVLGTGNILVLGGLG